VSKNGLTRDGRYRLTLGSRIKYGPTATRIRNWRNQRTIERGRMPRWERVTAEVKSRMPVYRNRINPAHGNKHREDARLHRTGNEGLKRMKETHAPVRAIGRGDGDRGPVYRAMEREQGRPRERRTRGRSR
jgi:hypothetical protein